MFIFSCLPQVMEWTEKNHNTIIWISWFEDRGTKPWNTESSPASKSDRERRG